MKPSGNYYRDLEAVQRMASFKTLPAQESNSRGGKHRKKVQQGIKDDGREAIDDKLHTPPTNPLPLGGSQENEEFEFWTLPPIPKLKCDRDTAIQAFVSLNKTFDDKNLSGGFSNSDEAMAARDIVEEAFGDLCATHGKLAAATDGSWIDIACTNLPIWMTTKRTRKRKKRSPMPECS